MKRIACATAVALAAVLSVVAGAWAQQPVARDLRIAADASGGALPQQAAPPGEKRYHLEEGVLSLHIAFDCLAGEGDAVQLRVMQPPGSILFQEDRLCSAAGPQVVTYERGDQPLAVNEYVVNMYVGQSFLADSVQFTVGDAQIPPPRYGEPGESEPIAPEPPPGGAVAVTNELVGGGSPADTVGGPSRWLLVVAAAGILGLMAVVGWAGWSAVRD